MLEFFLKGGPLMWPILLCSVIAITITLERLYHFHRLRGNLPNLLSRVKKLLLEDKFHEAEKLCEGLPGPVAHILAIGIHIRDRSSEEKEKVIARAGSGELRRLEKNLRGLGIIAHISPLLGLLGTVTGMIRAFMKIQELGGRVDASVLAGGIWEALMTTAAGLSVAIPTIVFYHYFEGKIDNFSSQMKDAAEALMEWLRIKSPDVERKSGQSPEDVEYGI
ncbi:MotA/TolQ/ExbB proton channel family protein [candidate division NPL-UPA2 bacterium Unc8]|uniref:MotA/TolQ/ExbB proton channel family protein n=1 Tax=candidate division NPL-UPA2 bacterium Unc8 TaxID=1980939 RepID=A0A399FVH7_UNCN2|nr:MAG: MotA/TolQ/ExbB proton channel family protein [candidate division NPL-UPA2 bacterium Unc8]